MCLPDNDEVKADHEVENDNFKIRIKFDSKTIFHLYFLIF